jgi:hypothetical protein
MLKTWYFSTLAATALVVSSLVPASAQSDLSVNDVVQLRTTGQVDEATCSTAADRYIVSLRDANLADTEFDARLTDLIVGLASNADALPTASCLIVASSIRTQALAYNDPALAGQANEIADTICQGDGVETAAIGAPFSFA